MKTKKLTCILLIVVMLIIGTRLILLNTLKFTLGLDSVSLQVVDVFKRIDSLPIKPIFNKRIDISIPIDGAIEFHAKKHKGSYIDIFSGRLNLCEKDYLVYPSYQEKLNPLSFFRYYNSTYSYQKTVLGHGWRPFWDLKFSIVNDIYSFQTASGEIVAFKFSTKDNQFYAIKNSRMNYILSLIPGTTSFKIMEPNGVSYIFRTKMEELSDYILEKIIHSNGLEYIVNFDAKFQRVVSIEENLTHRMTKYDYSRDKKRITKVIFPSGITLLLEYDENNNLTMLKNKSGNYQRQYSYDISNHRYLLTGAGQNNIQTKFIYEQKKLTKVEDMESNLIVAIERDLIFGFCKLKYSNDAIFKFQNSGDLNINIVGPNDFQEQMQFDDKGRIKKHIDSQNTSVEYTWNKNNQLIQQKNRLQGEEIFDYDENGNMKSHFDALGNMTQYIYSDGLKVREISPNNDILKFSYKGKMLASVYDEQNNCKKNYYYDTAGNMTIYESCADEEVYYKYNKDGYVTEKKSSKNWAEKYSWQGGLLKSIKYVGVNGDMNVLNIYEYDKSGNLISVMDAGNEKVTFGYDKWNRIKLIVYPSGEQKHFNWSANGLLLEYTDQTGDKFNYTYDQLNRVIKVSKNDNTETYNIEYDLKHGCQVEPGSKSFSKIIYQGEALVEFFYNKGYLIKEIKKADGSTKFYEYDQQGNLITESNSDNKRVSFFYDKNNNLNSIYDGFSKKAFFVVHNWKKQLVEFTDRNLNSYKANYDQLGNLVSIYKGESSNPVMKWQWDNGNVIAVTDGYQKKKWFYSFNNQLTGSYNSEDGFIQYNYNLDSTLHSKTDNMGRKVNYLYNSAKRIKEKQLVNSNISYKMSYTMSGDLKESKALSKEHEDLFFKNTWTNKKELKQITFDTKNMLLIAYTQSGKVAKKDFLFTPGRITQINTFNNNGILETVSEGGGTDPINYFYNSNGTMQRIEYPNNLITTYEYNDSGDITDMTTKNSKGQILFKRAYSYEISLDKPSKIVTERGYIKRKYDENGMLIYESLDDKNNSSYSYEYENNKISIVKFKSNKEAYALKYLYDENSNNLISINYLEKSNQDLSKNLRVDLYGKTYKPVGFLEIDKEVVIVKDNKFKVSNVELNPGLNKINVHSISASGREKDFFMNYIFNPLGFKSYKYDLTGKLTFSSVKGANKKFQYNDEGAIEFITTVFGSKLRKTQYHYYSNNLLCKKSTWVDSDKSNKKVSKYLFDENGNIIAEINKNAPYGYKYIYMFSPNGQILFRNDRENSMKYYYHLDKDGSVIGISDRLGNAAAAYSYDAFGKTYILKQKIDNPFLYLGHFFDKESELYFHKGLVYNKNDHAKKFNSSVQSSVFVTPQKALKALIPEYFDKYVDKETIKKYFNILPIKKIEGNKRENRDLLDPSLFYSKK